MPHDHHGHNCGCDPNDDSHLQVEGTQDFLFSKIDHEHVTVLNGKEGFEAKKILRAWDERNLEGDEYGVESDADEQLLIHIPFTGSIKLRSIIIKAGPSTFTPSDVRIFANQSLDFDEATAQTPTQSIEIAVTRDPVEYALRPSKFPAVNGLTLFFPGNSGDEETTKINFVGFKGEFKEFTRDPVITVYEATANPADHNKIPGIDNVGHSQIG